MKIMEVHAGDIVVSDFGVYQHWSIVSDVIGSNGFPKLISATKRNGTVQEESWDVVTQGKRTYVANVERERSVQEILKLARSKIGTWVYSVTDHNCEHFAKWASGLKVSSTQVVAGTSGAILGATIVGFYSEKPKAAKILGGAVLLAGLAVLASKATQQK
jgi:hypothetical protein